MVAVALLALLGGWIAFDGSTGDETVRSSETTAPVNRPSTPPPASASPTTGPVRPVGPVPRSTAAGAAKAVRGEPRKILLPQLALTARVVPITDEGGVLTPPSNPRAVGWWSAGARPGDQVGSAVLTAHTVHTGGGAFDDLGKLLPGAIVTVVTATGRLAYVARSVTTYPKRSLAKHAAELFDQTTQGRLVLVTCEDWDGETYRSNVVVIAEPVG
jgi:sortase family protein